MQNQDYQVMAVDLGGTNLRAGIYNNHGECLVQHKTESLGEEGGEVVFKRLTEFLMQLPAEADLKWENISGIGIGAPGPMDVQAGVINFTPNIPGWVQFPLAKRLYEEFHRPVFLNYDSTAAALGEHWLGVARGLKDFIVMTLGTGIGGCIFVNGKPYKGHLNKAGEVGHMTVNPFGRACGCGNIGCLEAHSGSRAVTTRYQYLARSGKRTTLKKVANKVSFQSIVEAARDGDGLCQQVITDAAEYLGIGIASLINIFNPESVILTGGITGAMDLMLPRIREQVDRRALIASSEDCKIITGTLGDDAGLLGAVRWTLDALEISA